MTTRARIAIPEDSIAQFCERWAITELDLFGSVIRDDFRPDSDVDVLVRFSPESRWTLFDLAQMEHELAEIFGRHVDLVDRKSVEKSHNFIKKRSILDEREPIYAAR